MQGIARVLFLGDVVKDEDKAFFAVNLYRVGRHEAGHARTVELACHQVQFVHPAIARKGFQQARALVLGGPDVEFCRGAAHHVFARPPQQLAERGVDFDVAPIGHARDACRVGQRLVDGVVLGLGGAQGLLGGAAGGHVQAHADHAQGLAVGAVLGHAAAREHPAPLAVFVAHPQFGFVGVDFTVHGLAQGVGQAGGVIGVAQAGPVGGAFFRGYLEEPELGIEVAVERELAVAHVPLPLATARGADGTDQLLLALAQGLVFCLQGVEGAHAHQRPQQGAQQCQDGGAGQHQLQICHIHPFCFLLACSIRPYGWPARCPTNPD